MQSRMVWYMFNAIANTSFRVQNSLGQQKLQSSSSTISYMLEQQKLSQSIKYVNVQIWCFIVALLCIPCWAKQKTPYSTTIWIQHLRVPSLIMIYMGGFCPRQNLYSDVLNCIYQNPSIYPVCHFYITM